ncbi:hypothetical protein [Kingella oralis]
MVKAASQFNHKAQTIFRLPHPVNKRQPENKKSVFRLPSLGKQNNRR